MVFYRAGFGHTARRRWWVDWIKCVHARTPFPIQDQERKGKAGSMKTTPMDTEAERGRERASERESEDCRLIGCLSRNSVTVSMISEQT